MPSSPVSKQRAADLKFLTEHAESEQEAYFEERRKEIYGRRDDRVKAEAEQTIRLMKRRAEQEFIAAGGTDEEFSAEWPELKKVLIRNRIKDSLALPQASLVRGF